MADLHPIGVFRFAYNCRDGDETFREKVGFEVLGHQPGQAIEQRTYGMQGVATGKLVKLRW